MGPAGVRRPLVAGAKLLGLLAGLLLCVLLAFRAAASLREGPVQPPPGMTNFAAPGAHVAAVVAGPEDGPRVLLVHGSAGWSGFWRDVTAHLASRGWRVIAVDLPPFGWSGRDPRGQYDRVSQAKRLSAVLAAVGSEPAVVVAHSFGAGAAVELAVRQPEQLNGLVLVDAALGQFDVPESGGVAAALRLRALSELATAATVTNPVALGPLLRPMLARKESAEPWLEVLRAPMRREGTTAAYARWLPSLFLADNKEISRRSSTLRQMRVPVSLIWGAADPVTPLEQGQRIAALTRARSLAVLPGVGHIPHIEDPDGFLAALDAALPTVRGS